MGSNVLNQMNMYHTEIKVDVHLLSGKTFVILSLLFCKEILVVGRVLFVHILYEINYWHIEKYLNKYSLRAYFMYKGAGYE